MLVVFWGRTILESQTSEVDQISPELIFTVNWNISSVLLNSYFAVAPKVAARLTDTVVGIAVSR